MCAAVFQTVEFLMTEKELVHLNDFNMEVTHLHKAFVKNLDACYNSCMEGLFDIFLSFARTDVLFGNGLVSSYRRAKAALLLSAPAVLVSAPFAHHLLQCKPLIFAQLKLESPLMTVDLNTVGEKIPSP